MVGLSSMKKLKILGLLDELTYSGLKLEENIVLLPLLKNMFWNKLNKPDLILVESAWFGYHNHWKHNLVNFPDKKSKLDDLIIILEWANTKGIPCIFWNKEDPIHYDKFIECAELFTLVATTDSDCLIKYPQQNYPFYLPFAYQPKIHYNSHLPLKEKINRGIFMGSYLKNNHPERKKWQDTFFPLFSEHGLDIYDRNSHLKNRNYAFPDLNNTNIFNSVTYKETGKIMRNYLFSINVNTITNSPTMFSRRLLESIASGCITFSNNSKAIDNLFKDSCIQIDSINMLDNHLYNIKNLNLKSYTDQVNYAQNHIYENYRYYVWFKKILQQIN